LRYILQSVEQLHAGDLSLRRFAWYPLFDCLGWNSLLQGARWRRDPQGLFTCDGQWQRQSTELSEIYRRIAHGLRSCDIPAYEFTARHERTLAALRRFMPWPWQPQ
jgi:hypothetical protein